MPRGPSNTGEAGQRTRIVMERASDRRSPLAALSRLELATDADAGARAPPPLPSILREWTMTPLRDIKSEGTDAVQSLSFSPKDDKFASCHDGGGVKVWDYNLYKGEVQRRRKCSRNWILKHPLTSRFLHLGPRGEEPERARLEGAQRRLAPVLRASGLRITR